MSSNAVAYRQIFVARTLYGRTSQVVFAGVVGLLFAGSAALTIEWCQSMSVMRGMPMPGGWTMSMAWMRMPGETWAGAAASFVEMWTVMMVAMMLPSFAPTLWRYRLTVFNADCARLNRLTLLFALGYFAMWSAIGVAIFPLGILLADGEMRLPALARAVPVAAGIVVLFAGALQFTTWKAHHPGCSREMLRPASDAVGALRQGLRLGIHCSCGCAGWTAVLLVMGVMDLRAMAAVTVAITLERLAPAGERVARLIGVVVIVAGLYMMARAV